MSQIAAPTQALLVELRQLIDSARQRAAVAVNAELTLLYWQVGQRIGQEILQGERAAYGDALVASIAQQLSADFGRGFSAKNLRHMLRFAQAFGDEQIVYSLSRQLSWTHLRTLIYLDDPIKRDFYIELCRLENWSVRQLQERMQSMLFERSAISKKPEETIRQDLALLQKEDQPTPALLLKDPYLLDFLDLNDRYLEKDLEDAILREIELFLLELGAGFTFVARQNVCKSTTTIFISTYCFTTAN